MEYDILRPWLTLDPWQKEYIETRDINCFLLCGRQSGKSAAMSIKIAECAINEKEGGDYLVIALTENQAYALFFKTLMYLEARYPERIARGLDKPTMHEINIKIKGKPKEYLTINCHAAGISGDPLRHYTLKRLFIDEAAPMNREIFVAVSPMLSVTGGFMDLSSTPRGKEGFFYDCSKREDFKQFYVSAEDCPRMKKEFLEIEKKNMTKLQYAQEYLAAFLDELKRLFPEDLLKESCILKRPEIMPTGNKYMGLDIARLGEDEGTFEIINRTKKDHFEQIQNIITKKRLTTETETKILELEMIYNPVKIGIDAGAGTLGVSILDHLLTNDKVKRKLIALTNQKRQLNRDGTNSTKLLKEDMYLNLKAMMEHGRLKLLNDDEVIASLSSVQYEYEIEKGKPTKVKIYGSYTHVAEGLIRAAWLASQDKSLNPFIY
jgi:hypothetical protein